MIAERARIYLDSADPSPEKLRMYFAEVFASLDAHPRPLFLRVFAENDAGAGAGVEISEGEPVFKVEGRIAARAAFRMRWIGEHPSPLTFAPRGGTSFIMTPTTGNRVRVRPATILERFAERVAAFLGASRVLCKPLRVFHGFDTI